MRQDALHLALGFGALAVGWWIFERSQTSKVDAPLLGLVLTGGALASIFSRQKGLL